MNAPFPQYFNFVKFKFLGFTNSKRVDASSNTETKAALDKALMEQMQRITMKQRQAEKEAVSPVLYIFTRFGE
jgi:hypothetical protein